MNHIGRRIEQLEERLEIKRGQRVIVFTINPDQFPEDPYAIEISRNGLWAFANRGGPFTEEEKRALRKKYSTA